MFSGGFSGVIILFLLLCVQLSLGYVPVRMDRDKFINSADIQAVEGKRVSLECPLLPPDQDVVLMVLWFRDDSGIPLYTYDARKKSVADGLHWSAPKIFGSRARFNTNKVPATLDLTDLKRHDQGVYRCRVDFRTSQTQSFRHNLTIIIPPEYPIVLDRYGRQLNGTQIGPVQERDDITLTCRVVGGRPQPTVRWLINGQSVDEEYEHNSGDVIENRLTRPSVNRSDLNAVFTCQAVNTKLVEPREARFTLDLLLKPLSATIHNTPTHFVADKKYDIQCDSHGSRPNAIITWYKNKRQMNMKRTKSEAIHNITRSTLTFEPTTEDDGKSITCRAENPRVTGLFIEHSIQLNVVFPPLVSLRLGSTLAADDIKEGDDVYFECQVKANPHWRKLYWLHNGLILSHNVSARVIRSNQSLVLQRVSRMSSGNYSCSALNAEGETVSNEFNLRVKYAPYCSTEKIVVVGAFRSEQLNVHCEVYADPPPKYFRWKFNNSGETLDVGKERFHKNGSISILQYTPVTDQDYGTISCWGENQIGEQQQPCLFQIVLAALPTAVKNCSINNQTQHSIEVNCLPGYDGGLPQVFVLELIMSGSGRLRYNVTNTEEPSFLLESIDALTSPNHAMRRDDEHQVMKAIVFAVNQKGRSPGVIVKDFTINSDPNLPESSYDDLEASPIILGIIITILVLLLCIIIKIYFNSHIMNGDVMNNAKQSGSLLNKQDSALKGYGKTNPRWQHSDVKNGKDIKNSTDINEDERDPDVIPAQFVSSDTDTNNYTPPEWTQHDDETQFDRFTSRPRNLFLKSVHQTNPKQDLMMNTLYCNSRDTTSVVTNSNDLDINVHAIRNMLMTTRVPESCV